MLQWEVESIFKMFFNLNILWYNICKTLALGIVKGHEFLITIDVIFLIELIGYDFHLYFYEINHE